MKQIFTIAFLVILIVQVNSQNTVETVFDFNNMDHVADFIELDDGGFLILGSSREGFLGDYHKVLIRLNENGDTLWTKIDSVYLGGSVVQYDSNYFYFAGGSSSNGILTKTNSDYEIIWQNEEISGENGYYSYSGINKLNNNRLIFKRESGPNDGNYPPNIRCLIVDTTGNYIWGGSSFPESILPVNDSVFLVSGFDDIYYPDHANLKRWPSNEPYSNIPDYKSLLGYTYNSEIVSQGDTAFIVGWHNETNIQLVAANLNNGDILFTETFVFPYSSRTKSICKAGNDNMLALISHNSNGLESTLVFNFNSSGDSISTSVIDKFDMLRPVKVLFKNGYMYIVANICDFNEEGMFYYKDIYFLKAPVDTVMVSQREVQTLINGKHFLISPNPAKIKVSVLLNIEVWESRQLKVTSLNGAEVYNKTIPPNITKHEIDISNWQAGIYVLSLYEEGELLQTEKVVVVR